MELTGLLPAIIVEYLPELALAGALAWGAGLRLYFVVFLFGLAGQMQWWELPGHLEVLEHPIVIGAAGFMAIIELFADKVPFLDSVWDAAQTLIRIPAGAILAGMVFGDSEAAIALAAALLGGGITATTHFSKSGTRAAANASPEPLSNIVMSIIEDVLVVAGSWLAVTYPIVFLALLLIFLAIAVLLVRWIIRGIKRIRNARWPGSPPQAPA